MRLSILTASIEGLSQRGPDVEITGLALDSRAVQPGDLFIAIPGVKQDGRAFVADAVAKGAVAVVMPFEEGTGLTDTPTILTTPDIRRTTAALASAFYPRQPATIAAITGTSGKTSTAQFTRELWAALGDTSASIGTLGLVTADTHEYGALTTPDALTLHRLLDRSASQGITHLALEASSHGLDLRRLDYVQLKAGGFTNLSRDHLDYHPDMAAYLAAKQRLFTELLPLGAAAVLNADIPEFTTLQTAAKARGLQVLSYGRAGGDLKLVDAVPATGGQRLTLEVLGTRHDILLPVIGTFQVWNTLCALGLVIGCGAAPAAAVTAVARLTGVPGRLQLAGYTASGGAIFIDYAHKPDALDNVLTAMRPHVAAHPGGKLGVVFGCGGNRDTGKRPLMGAIAARLADWVIVTDDNPRFEDAAAIRAEVLAGLQTGPDLQEIGDRATAIRAGIDRLRAGDVLIVAGKGHEPGQIIGDTTLPFDDLAVARQQLTAP